EGAIDVTKNDYDDGYLIGIGPLDQDFRDETTTDVGGRASYAISPDVAVFVQGKHSNVDYRVTSTPSRNSSQNYYQVGSSFELTAPFRGDIAVGYLESKSKSGRDFDGPAVDGRLQWFPTQITTVTLVAARSVFDPGLLQSSIAVDTAVSVHIDHELRRNIILFGDLGYDNQDFQDFDRNDKIVNFGVGVGYKLNRHARVDFGYTLRNQDSTGTGQDGTGATIPQGPRFTDNIVSVSLRLFP
ncbi:MAG: outer membrane beta-barrel protein, partial [Alphaproteobacteria bacterium]